MSDITPSKKPRWQKLLGVALMAFAGAMFGFLVTRFSISQLPASLSLKSLSVWDLLALPAIMVFVLACHEAGHLAGGMCRGMRFLLFIAGPFGWVRGKDGVRFRWFFNLGTLGGVAAALPLSERPLKPQLTSLVVRGPLASAILAAVAFAVSLAWGGQGRISAYALITGGLSLSIFVVTAVPLRSGGFMSDGMQMLQLRRNPAMVERRARLVALISQGLAGLRPRDYDRQALAHAQAITGDEVLYDVGIWIYSYYHALDNGDIATAEDFLRRVEPLIDEYPDGFRQAIAVELALFEALHRHRLDRAQGWLVRARGGVVDVSRRRLAEAAIAALEGRQRDALTALAGAEAKLGRSMDSGAANLSADQIAWLRADISVVRSFQPRA